MATCSRRPPESQQFLTKIRACEYENESWTHLASAAASGHVELVKKYMTEQPHLPVKGEIHFGWYAFPNPTPLILAAGHGHLDCVRLLMKNDLALDSTTEIKQTALMAAAAGCYTDIVHELLEKQAGRADDNGWTALMYAADRGCAPVCQILIKVESNRRSNRHETALILAATANKKDVVEILAPHEAAESGLLAMELTSSNEIRDIISKNLPADMSKLIAEGQDEYMFH